ncbi:hypothetical protein TNCV_1079051 [Trichonephila clavipes]|nr:hypothetical protein TNCV_1079051 [Trichonephila clavipes]
MRQLIAVTPDSADRKPVDTGSYTRWNHAYDQVPDSPEADLKRLFNPAMVVEDTVPKQTSEQWGDSTQLLDKFQTIFSQNKYDVGCINFGATKNSFNLRPSYKFTPL